MDDLISRKAAIEFANKQLLDKETGMYSKGRNAGLRIMKSALNNPDAIPSVPAVPLDMLCEFLEKCGTDSYCGTCKQIMGGCFTDGNDCGSEYFWKQLLTKWMEKQNEAD